MEATVLLGFIGVFFGFALSGLWLAVDLLIGSHTLTPDRLIACLLLGAILTPVGVGIIMLIGDKKEH